MMEDNINHPAHYAGVVVKIECIDLTRHLNFQLGNAVKYLWRAGKKGGKEQEIEDLEKALWYLQDYDEHPVAFDNTSARAIVSLLPHVSDDHIMHIIHLIAHKCIDAAINILDWRIRSCSSQS